MCDTCGCGESESQYKIEQVDDESAQSSNEKNKHDKDYHGHSHGHGHGHGFGHSHGFNHEVDESVTDKVESEHSIPGKSIIPVSASVLSRNSEIADRNREYFTSLNLKVFNLVSSPGSGKTTLLENIIGKLDQQIYVIEGDQQTTFDADRIRKAGAKAIQVNTGNGCHLDAGMIDHAVKVLKPEKNGILFIENVGNLVCPALFDLGEQFRILAISVTEGDDKPMKYPTMFETSQVCIINKIDLLPYVNFDVDEFRKNAMKTNHLLKFFEVSATTNAGVPYFIKWIESLLR